jgi:catechol 2,3-dioxygenase-like lactoylglutathione lyase family enzyme
MFIIDSIVLYVEDINRSKDFYADIFNCEPQVLSPTFVALEFASNVTITLKQSADLTPASSVTGGGTELSMPVADKTIFNALYQSWCAKGVKFAQTPAELIFGFNFVALDPDGHRIRVFTK